MEVSFSSAFKRTFKKRIKGNTDLDEKAVFIDIGSHDEVY